MLKKNCKALQTNITDAQKENVKLLASQNPSDPNKKLSSGISLWDAKLWLDHTKASMEARGYSDDKIQSLLAYQAQDMGTTLDEINRLPTQAPEKIVQQQQAPVQHTAPVKHSSSHSIFFFEFFKCIE